VAQRAGLGGNRRQARKHEWTPEPQADRWQDMGCNGPYQAGARLRRLGPVSGPRHRGK
jgi:hypothetical protein